MKKKVLLPLNSSKYAGKSQEAWKQFCITKEDGISFNLRETPEEGSKD